MTWAVTSPHGVVFSFTIIRKTKHPFFRDLVPYVHAMIQLDGGTFVTSNIIDSDPESVFIGMGVTAQLDTSAAALGLILFTERSADQ